MRASRLVPVLVAGELVVLAAPFTAGLVVDRLIAGDWRGFVVGTAVLIALPFLEGLMFWRWEWAQGLYTERGAAALRRRMAAHLFRLPLSWFVTQKTGVLVSRATTDVQFLVAHARVRLDALRGVITLAIVGVVVALQHPLLAVALAVSALPHVLDLRRTRGTGGQLAAGVVDGADDLNEYFRERLDLMVLTRTSGASAWELAECGRAVDRKLDADLARARFDGGVGARTGLIQSVGTLALLLGGGWLVLGGDIGVGGFVMAFGYAGRVTQVLGAWVNWYREAGEAAERSRRIGALLDVPPEPVGDLAPPDVVETVELRGVRVGFPDRPVVLDGLDLTVRRGEVVAIVGPSGAGKSTLADLVAGLIRPDEGAILVNGATSLAEYDAERWRRRVAYAPQFPYFFTDALAANLRYGESDVDTDLAAMAPLARELALERVFDRASRAPGQVLPRDALSGGERQRLGLLRASLRERPLVAVFDEPTSALDSLTEERAMRLVLAYRGVAPVLVIAHRLATVGYCDRVVVLRDGRIVEDGPPRVLLERDGPYAALCRTELRA